MERSQTEFDRTGSEIMLAGEVIALIRKPDRRLLSCRPGAAGRFSLGFLLVALASLALLSGPLAAALLGSPDGGNHAHSHADYPGHSSPVHFRHAPGTHGDGDGDGGDEGCCNGLKAGSAESGSTLTPESPCSAFCIVASDDQMLAPIRVKFQQLALAFTLRALPPVYLVTQRFRD